jgi:prepilin-type N-terminal cleavage/methylation domain-containing protein
VKRLRKLASDDAGFTLLELISAIVIMGIITLPLGNFMIEYLQNTTNAQARISDSHDVQIATAYFAQDVSNMGVRNASNGFDQSAWTATSSSLPASYCGSGAGNALVLLLEWSAVNTTVVSGVTTETTPKVSSAAYVNRSGALHRLYCDTGTTVTSDATVVHGFSSATVACDTTCDASTPPSTITLTLTIAATGDRVAPSPVPLIGHRRQ